MIEYPWMAIARSKLGEHEIPGPEANAFIVECLESTTLDRREAYRASVVCSQCGRTYHQACWQKAGTCDFCHGKTCQPGPAI